MRTQKQYLVLGLQLLNLNGTLLQYALHLSNLMLVLQHLTASAKPPSIHFTGKQSLEVHLIVLHGS